MTDIPGEIGNDNLVGTENGDTFKTGGGGVDVFEGLGGSDTYVFERVGSNLYATGSMTITDLGSSGDVLDITERVPTRADQLGLAVAKIGADNTDLEISFGSERIALIKNQFAGDENDGIETIRYAGNSASIKNLDTAEEIQAKIISLFDGSNRAPLKLDEIGPYPIDEDSDPLEKDLSGLIRDQDGDALEWKIEQQPDKGKATIDQDGNFKFVQSPNDFGSKTVKISATDADGGKVEHTINIEINPVNDAPTVFAYRSWYWTGSDDVESVYVYAEDVDDDFRNLTLDGPFEDVVTDKGTLRLVSDDFKNGNGARYEFDANEGAEGEVRIPISVRDDGGEVGTDDLVINLYSFEYSNSSPVIDRPVTFRLNEDAGPKTLDFKEFVTDADGDPLNFRVIGDGTEGKLGYASISENGVLTYTPDPNAFGNDRVRFRVDDGGEFSYDEADVTIEVVPVNDAPVIDADPVITVDENGKMTSLNLKTFVSDIEGDSLRFSMTEDTDLGLLEILVDGRVRFTPGKDESGDDEVTFTVSDGKDSVDGELFLQVIPEPPASPPPPPPPPPPSQVPTSGDDNLVLSSGNDKIKAGPGDDTISDLDGKDNIKGEENDDTFLVGSGKDKFDGGSGVDRAVFEGDSSGYTIKISTNGKVTVKDTNPVDGFNSGKNKLKNIEFLEFDDGEIDVGANLGTKNPPASPAGASAPQAVADLDSLVTGESGLPVA